MTDFSAYQQQLLAMERELIERRSRLDQHGRAGVPADFEEQASERENDEVVESLSEQATAELAQVKAALTRIELGSYGTCVRCGEAIAAARLQAVPYATACTSCG
ncbi:MAG: TraR/DksA family transcriptional regulator [Gammaproteobacteria bacterium]|nr:TraR/DksA family transcriptional regulator [Gammaproteobacteria bacterium]